MAPRNRTRAGDRTSRGRAPGYVVRDGHREADEADDPRVDVESERIDRRIRSTIMAKNEEDHDDRDGERVPLPRQRQRPEAHPGEDRPLHRRAFGPVERTQGARGSAAGADSPRPTDAMAGGLDRPEVAVDGDEDEERVEAEVVRVAERRRIDVRHHQGVEERRDDTDPLGRDLLADEVDREDSQRGPERALELEEPGAGGRAFPPKNGAKRIPKTAFIQSNSGSRGLTAENG